MAHSLGAFDISIILLQCFTFFLLPLSAQNPALTFL